MTSTGEKRKLHLFRVFELDPDWDGQRVVALAVSGARADDPASAGRIRPGESMSRAEKEIVNGVLRKLAGTERGLELYDVDEDRCILHAATGEAFASRDEWIDAGLALESHGFAVVRHPEVFNLDFDLNDQEIVSLVTRAQVGLDVWASEEAIAVCQSPEWFRHYRDEGCVPSIDLRCW